MTGLTPSSPQRYYGGGVGGRAAGAVVGVVGVTVDMDCDRLLDTRSSQK